MEQHGGGAGRGVSRTGRRGRRGTGRDDGGALAWILGGVAGLVVVLVAVFVLFGELAQFGADEPVDVDEVREGSLTVEQYEAVDLGAQKEELLTELRPAMPVDTRVIDRFEGREPETIAAECVYYERSGGRAGEQFRFCFDEDVLVDKAVLLAGDPGVDSPVVEEEG